MRDPMRSKALPESMRVGYVTLQATGTLPIGLPVVGEGSHVEVSYLNRRYPARVIHTDGQTSDVTFEVPEEDLFDFVADQMSLAVDRGVADA